MPCKPAWNWKWHAAQSSRSDASAPEHLLFGAGIGVTPLLAMAYRLWAEQKPFTLHYFVRAREHAAFADLLETHLAARVRFHYAVMPAQMEHYLTACLDAGSRQAHVYTCGPAPFMDAVVTRRRQPQRRRDPPGTLPGGSRAAPAPLRLRCDGAFEVKLASSGKVVQIPVGIPIVDILAREGVSHRYPPAAKASAEPGCRCWRANRIIATLPLQEGEGGQ
jgi:vanillate O-demethylase ferredoxin subunit